MIRIDITEDDPPPRPKTIRATDIPAGELFESGDGRLFIRCPWGAVRINCAGNSLLVWNEDGVGYDELRHCTVLRGRRITITTGCGQ